MNKDMFIKHMKMLTNANNAWHAIEDVTGGDFENDLTRVLNVIPEFYAEFCKPDIDKGMFHEALWDLVFENEYECIDFVHITNWEEFYDFFFVK